MILLVLLLTLLILVSPGGALAGGGMLSFAAKVPARWNKFAHLKPYRRNNSPDGVRYAARHQKRIDLDFQETIDEIWAWCHWGRLWIEGFRYTKDSVAVAKRLGYGKVKVGAVCRRTVRTTHYELIATLRTKDGRRIGTAHEALTLAHQLHVDVEVEAKGHPSIAMFDRLATLCHSLWGAPWRQHVQVKRIALGLWKTTLHRAKNAQVKGQKEQPGFIVFAIQYRGRASALPSYVDYYRR